MEISGEKTSGDMASASCAAGIWCNSGSWLESWWNKKNLNESS
jgi:hypothetical protein